MRNKRKIALKRVALTLGVSLLLLGADYVLYPHLPHSTQTLMLPSDGAWLHFDYAAGKATETPAALGARLRADGIRDAYFHVRYIGQSGRLRFDIHQTAQGLNRQMKRDAPHIRRFAWLYIGSEQGITGVDLARVEVRARIVQVCRGLMQDGFDGLHIDYEICPSGDPNFLRLLEEIHRTLPVTTLSVATPLWLPFPVGAHGWREDYFRQVAKRCDQVAVMGYDSALYSPRLYVWLIREQIIHVARATAGTRCRVVIGVPTYEDGGLSHDPHTENLPNALRGVREGMADSPYADQVEGVALFADYTMDAAKWSLWRANVR